MKTSGRIGSFKKFREEGSSLKDAMKQTEMEHVINPSPSSLLF
jgi:hypothetical protein